MKLDKYYHVVEKNLVKLRVRSFLGTNPVRRVRRELAHSGVLVQAPDEVPDGLAPPVRHKPRRLLRLLGDQLHVAAFLLGALRLDAPMHQIVQIDTVLVAQLPLLPGAIFSVQVPRFIPPRQKTVRVGAALDFVSEKGVHLFQRDASVLHAVEGRHRRQQCLESLAVFAWPLGQASGEIFDRRILDVLSNFTCKFECADLGLNSVGRRSASIE